MQAVVADRIREQKRLAPYLLLHFLDLLEQCLEERGEERGGSTCAQANGAPRGELER